MIEIIKNSMEEPSQMICEDCASIFKYTYDEIRSESSINILSSAFYRRFVVCPVCKHRNEINSIEAGEKDERRRRMIDKEKQKHIDAFKYWCETNEECGVITIPKFVCDNIIKILDNAPIEERPQGKWKEYKLRNDIVVEYALKCSNCKRDSGLHYHADFCPNCGAQMQKGGETNENSN